MNRPNLLRWIGLPALAFIAVFMGAGYLSQGRLRAGDKPMEITVPASTAVTFIGDITDAHGNRFNAIGNVHRFRYVVVGPVAYVCVTSVDTDGIPVTPTETIFANGFDDRADPCGVQL